MTIYDPFNLTATTPGTINSVLAYDINQFETSQSPKPIIPASPLPAQASDYPAIDTGVVSAITGLPTAIENLPSQIGSGINSYVSGVDQQVASGINNALAPIGSTLNNDFLILMVVAGLIGAAWFLHETR